MRKLKFSYNCIVLEGRCILTCAQQCLKSLNRQRTNILFSHLLEHKEILSPTQVAAKEYIFEQSGILRWNQGIEMAHCQIGVSLQDLLGSLSQVHKKKTGSSKIRKEDLDRFLEVFRAREYFIWYRTSTSTALIALKEDATVADQIAAWVHALLISREHTALRHITEESSFSQILAHVRQTGSVTEQTFRNWSQRLRDVGWQMDVAALETKPGIRVAMDTNQSM